MNTLACALTGTHEERVALCDVSIAAVLQDLLAEVTVAQTYRNEESAAIEAVYTFPLPLNAVLLEFEMTIGGRVLTGVVARKTEAEAAYEEAIAGGDSAVMLEENEPGLYTLSVGNLLPQETARITFRYAILYRWTGDRLRIVLPTTIAPRFGEWALLPQQTPVSSLTVENQFTLKVEMRGSLREARFQCPTHAVATANDGEAVVLTLRQAKAAMDRDFVLEIQAAQAPRSFVLCGQDGEGAAAVASFQPFFAGLQEERALKLVIVADCSGSMQGDSIRQAKLALQNILASLQPRDQVTIIAFGDTTRALGDQLLPCSRANLAAAKRFAAGLDADMGGTEIAAALRRAYAAAGGEAAGDIFVLTDGAVAGWQAIVTEAGKSGHRIFTVGVGSAVAEAFVRQLAAAAGGACELVSPREDLAERVVRHFARMRAPRARRAGIRWPAGAVAVAPRQLGAVFSGDTVVASARFERPEIGGSVVLEVETDTGEIVCVQLPLPPASQWQAPDGLSTVARLAAAARLQELDPGEGAEEALRYDLLSPWTNWLAVAVRPDAAKGGSLPALRIQPNTLAAGWGGVGSVHLSLMAADYSLYSCERPRLAGHRDSTKKLRRLLALVHADPARVSVAGALELLRECGLDADCEDLLRVASAIGLAPEAVAGIVLARLLNGPLAASLGDVAQDAAIALQARAEEFAALLESPDRPDQDLEHAMRQAADCGLFRGAGAGELAGRFAAASGLLGRLDTVVAGLAQVQGRRRPMSRRPASR